MEDILKNKKIILGVCGGIAAYKAAELSRLFVKEGASVFVTLSQNAEKFVTPLTFQALTGNPVYDRIFQNTDAASMEHIRYAEKADLMIVAPASANSIAKIANGFASDALSTLFIAYSGPVILAPAMNDAMWASPAVKENLRILKSRGISVVDPGHGELACGAVGLGRLLEPVELLEFVKKHLNTVKDLSHLTILVTAGPTQEPLDPVRFISNNSSGKMGYAIAEQARKRGAKVILISGPTQLKTPAGVKTIACQTAREMAAGVDRYLKESDILVMAAAVGDFSPENMAAQKIKKNGGHEIDIKLIPNTDILKEVANKKSGRIVVGFAAESENVLPNALRKLHSKQLDLIVANDISRKDIGFRSDYNQVTLIQGESQIEELVRLPKHKVADILLDRILELSRKNSRN